MKLSELGLKTKPSTKYFDGGYIAFSTQNKDLYYKIVRVTKTNQATLDSGMIRSKAEFDVLMRIKTIKEVVEAMKL